MDYADILATPSEGQRPMGWLLSYQAARDPQAPAVTFEGETWSRLQLDAAANRMARALADLGVGQDDFVATVLANGPQTHIFSFALWKLGASPLPISAKLPQAELMAILELAEPKLVIGPPAGSLGRFRSIPGDFQPDPALSDAPHPERVAKAWKGMTSGGSTGRPKVIIDGAPSLASATEPLALLQIRADDVILHPAPQYHNSFFAQANWALCAGAHVIGAARFDALEWLRLVERHKVRWAYLVPTMMNRIWNLTPEQRAAFDLSSLEVAMHMAAPCPAWLKAAWIDWLGPERIWEVFGATEPIGGSLISGVEWLAHHGSVGKPALTPRILDEHGADVPQGEVGEIHFPARTPEEGSFRYKGAERRVRDGWETLGDMGWLDADGYLYIADRRTDMILSGGANIFPAEIEAALDAHPAIASSAVVGLPDADFGRLPHAIIELAPGAAAPTAADLEAFLSQRLVRYKLPYTFDISPIPLRDDAGKVRRTALRDAREAELAAGRSFERLRSAKTAETAHG